MNRATTPRRLPRLPALWPRFYLSPDYVDEGQYPHHRLLFFVLAYLISVTLAFGAVLMIDPPREDPWLQVALQFIGLALAPWLGFGFALYTGAEFFQNLYAIKSPRAARLHYLSFMFETGNELAKFLGLRYASIRVQEGRLQADAWESPLINAGGPGDLVLSKDSAAVLEQDGCFTRAVGPGKTFLRPFERIRELIDLRPQVRSKDNVQALTKDGIPIQVNLEIEFTIQPGPPTNPERPWSSPFTFRGQAAYHAAYHKLIAKERIYHWNDLVMYRAQFELRRILNTYTLDRLIEPEDADARRPLAIAEEPRRKIQNELHRRLTTRNRDEERRSNEPNRATAKYFGATVLRVTLGTIRLQSDEKLKEPLTELRQQRIENWRADWLRRMKAMEGEEEAADLFYRELARAQAQAEMIHAIARGLETVARPGTTIPRQLLALRVIQALEDMAMSPWAQSFIPGETLQAIETLRNLYT